MSEWTTTPLRVRDELIEQPSWGGRYIIDLKGLSDAPEWAGKKVGQSYEMAKTSTLIDPRTDASRSLQDLIAEDAAGLLGQPVVDKFGTDLSLLIKLTQAKGNSYQVHLSGDGELKHWKPKPEAWFYLGPGLFTFGLKKGTSFEAFSRVLNTIDDEMQRLSQEVKSGRRTVEDARAQAKQRIQTLDPYAYINVIEAKTDDIVDLTAGGIHHSWEEDNARFPEGNLVYEVQVDVQDEYCSMRGFDKGKFLDDGGLRPTHVHDYLATINPDDYHNDLAHHIRQPQLISETDTVKAEALFRTPYFNLDRLTLAAGAASAQSLALGFHHLFIFQGEVKIGDVTLSQGQSYFVPAGLGEYALEAASDAVVLKTYLPLG